MPEPQPELLAHSQKCSRTHKQRFSVAVTSAAFLLLPLPARAQESGSTSLA
jgi:hypothetical protein